MPHEVTVRRQLADYVGMAFFRYLICSQLHLRLPSLQNCEKHISIVYETPSLWYFIVTAQAKTPGQKVWVLGLSLIH